MSESLKDLSDAATQGIWYTVDTPWGEGDWIVAGNPDPHAGLFVCLFDGSVVGVLPNDDDAVADAAENASFVADLVNAYRADRLHDDTALATAVARARREALEEAAGRVLEIEHESGELGVQNAQYVIEEILDLRAATPPEARQTETGWRPIETCPADGREIIVFGGRFDKPMATQADGDWWNSTVGRSLGNRPTHWMPLPAPPPPAIGNLEGEGRS